LTAEPPAPDEAELRRRAVVDSAGIGAVADLAPAPLGSAVRSSAVYAGAAVFQRGIIFLLLPVYTRVLAPAQYGRLSVLLAIAAAAAIVLSCGMDTAFFRAYFALQSDPAGQRRFVTTAWTFLLAVPPAIAALLALVAGPFLVHSEIAPPAELALALAGAALLVSGTVVPLALLRAEERLRDYLVLAAVTAGTTAALTLVAVVGLDAGVAGWLVAVVVANAVTLAAAIRIIPFRRAGGIDRHLLAGALALGLPLIPHMLSHWGLGISNRVLLAGMVSTSKVGIYALAANIALPVAIVMQGMAQGFMPSFARAATNSAALDALRRVVNLQFLLVLAFTTLGALLGPIAVRQLASPAYAGAADLVPWLALGYGLLGLYFIPMNAVALTAGRTRRVWVITLAAATTNLVCLVALVPRLGLLGAAMATPAGYLVLLAGVAIFSRGADNPVRYDAARMRRGLLVFAAVYGLAVATSGDRTLIDACIRCAWLGSAPALLVLAHVVDRDQLTSTAWGSRARGQLWWRRT
jgi:O-antigen/teichoic acid export membrane protein